MFEYGYKSGYNLDISTDHPDNVWFVIHVTSLSRCFNARDEKLKSLN